MSTVGSSAARRSRRLPPLLMLGRRLPLLRAGRRLHAGLRELLQELCALRGHVAPPLLELGDAKEHLRP
jgi:hypothetical protein